VPDEALQIERERALGRLRATDLARAQPALEELPIDPRWHGPVLPSPPISAVLLEVDPARRDGVVAALGRWGDVSVLGQADQESAVLSGVVSRARMQLRLFSLILSLTAAVIVTMVLWNMTLEKTHDLAVLSLLGAPRRRLVALVVQEAWMLGALGYVIALGLGALAYPSFPRRVVITEEIEWGAALAIFALTTLASTAGVLHALRIDPSRVLEG